MPFFLLFEAAAFYLPHVLWDCLSSQAGLNIANIVEMSRDPNNMKKEHRLNTLETLTTHLENALRFHKRLSRRHVTPHKFLRCLNFPYSSNYTTSLYLTVKLLYLINVILQLYVLNAFMETGSISYGWYGFKAIGNLLNGISWERTGLFPLVTLCE